MGLVIPAMFELGEVLHRIWQHNKQGEDKLQPEKPVMFAPGLKPR